MSKRPHLISSSEKFGYSYDDPMMIQEYTTPFLDLDALKTEERSSEATKKKIYKLILAKCHEKIKRMNRKTNNRECWYDIPFFLPGYPVYDVGLAKEYVMYQLSLNGIYVKDVGGNRVYIAWREDYINHNQYLQRLNNVTPKPNIYKVSVSPIDQRQSQEQEQASKRRPKIFLETDEKQQETNVSMLQYDDRLVDMIPVNAKKAGELYHDKDRINTYSDSRSSSNNSNDRRSKRNQLNKRLQESRKERECSNSGRNKYDEESHLDSHYFR